MDCASASVLGGDAPWAIASGARRGLKSRLRDSAIAFLLMWPPKPALSAGETPLKPEDGQKDTAPTAVLRQAVACRTGKCHGRVARRAWSPAVKAGADRDANEPETPLSPRALNISADRIPP